MKRSACSTIKARWCAAPQSGHYRNCWSEGRSWHWLRAPPTTRLPRPCKPNGRIAPPTLDFIAPITPWSGAMTNQPFFTRRDDAFIPNPVANGPWDPNSMHGRVIVGLLAFAIEERHGAEDFVPARLTVD